jgi:hypothetical protein
MTDPFIRGLLFGLGLMASGLLLLLLLFAIDRARAWIEYRKVKRWRGTDATHDRWV